MKLCRIKDDSYYISGFTKLGVLVNQQQEALLIDTGVNEKTGRQVKQILIDHALTLKAIVLTHSHADHCGAAGYLSKGTGAKVYASAFEKSIIENPILEPLYLFGGALPPGRLRSPMVCAPGVSVDGIIVPGNCEVEGFHLEIVDLSGHSPGQVGISNGEVLFCADSLMPVDQLLRQGIPKNADIAQALVTLDRLAARHEEWFVSAHGPLVRETASAVAANRQVIMDTIAVIRAITAAPCSVESILVQVCEQAKVTIHNMTQYYLLHLTILAYISYLLDTDALDIVYKDNRQLFCGR